MTERSNSLAQNRQAKHRGTALVLALLVTGVGVATAVENASDDDGWRERLVDDGRTNYLEDVSGNDCLRCHQAIGEEWRESLHALAWEDPHYQKELKKVRRKKSCWGCHVPEALEAQDWKQKPDARSGSRHLGIDCAACHVDKDGETILGPFGVETDAHPTRKSERFDHEASSEMCVTCHATSIGPVIGIAKDFVETEQTDLGLSCVGCHMPAVKRPIANDPDSGEPTETRRGRSHRLMTPRDPEFLREAFLFRAKRSADGIVLEVENQCGHRVPGLTERRFTLKVKVLDESGKTAGRGELVIDNRNFLPVEESRELTVDAEGVKLELEGLYDAPGVRRPVTFLERTLDVK